MLNFRRRKCFRFERTARGRRQRGIFGIDPMQQRPPFFGIRIDQIHVRRWRKKCGDRWINDLVKLETNSMSEQRRCKKTRDRQIAASRRVPIENERLGGLQRCHLGKAVAKETEAMPCSSAALVTAITDSYEVRRSALIMMERFSRLAASSNGPN